MKCKRICGLRADLCQASIITPYLPIGMLVAFSLAGVIRHRHGWGLQYLLARKKLQCSEWYHLLEFWIILVQNVGK
jgi:hypothetical protein